MSSKDDFLKAFREGHKCDFCEEENAQILTITLHPVYKQVTKGLCFSGYLATHKCMQCLEEEMN